MIKLRWGSMVRCCRTVKLVRGALPNAFSLLDIGDASAMCKRAAALMQPDLANCWREVDVVWLVFGPVEDLRTRGTGCEHSDHEERIIRG